MDDIKSLDGKAAEELADLVDKYPYCQAALLLHTIALANIHSTRLSQQVQRTAAAMPDRLKLCQMVSNGEFEWMVLMEQIEEKKKCQAEENQHDDFLLVERYLDNIGEAPTDLLPYNLASVEISDYDLDEDFLPAACSDDQDELIDSFIKAEENGELFVPKVPELSGLDEEEDCAISLKKIREKAFLSESLAKIYVKQHKYEQAIAIFSSLNLKYSKKITYFADQIRYLETIQSYRKGKEKTQEK